METAFVALALGLAASAELAPMPAQGKGTRVVSPRRTFALNLRASE